MSKVRIVFLGTPEFAVTSLARLASDEHFEIVAVISQPDRPAGRKMQLKASPVKDLALRLNLPVLTPQTVNTEEFRAQIAALRPQSAAVVAFGQILGQKFLDLFPLGAVNVHGSLLPRWRGAAPIQRAVMAGDLETGVALQIIVRKLDAGPLLGVRKMPIPESLDATSLHDALKDLGADLLHVEYMDYLRGNLSPVIQDESLVTVAPKIEKAEAKIDWTQSAREIFNRIRGLTMGPSAYSILAAGRESEGGSEIAADCATLNLKIHLSRVILDAGQHGLPGEVLPSTPGTLQVACGQGVLEVLEIQPESRSRQKVVEFLRGYRLQSSARFL